MRRVIVGRAVLLLLSCVSTSWSGEREWVLATSPNFKVMSDTGTGTARELATQLERMHAAVEQFMNAKTALVRPVTLIAVRNEKGLHELLPSYGGRRSGKRIGGSFIDVEQRYWAVVRLDTADPTHSVRHEYVHLMVAARFGEAPLWLNEGLAEFYGSARFTDDEANVGVILQHVSNLRQQVMLPIDKLVAVDHGSPEYQEEGQAGTFYAQSAVLTHYLLIADGGKHRARLREYLRLITEEDVDDQAAVERAFGGSRKLLNELAGYVHRRRFNSAVSKMVQVEAPITTRVLRRAEADALLAGFHLDMYHHDPAREHVDAALRSEPELAEARLQQARLLQREGQLEKAAEAFSAIAQTASSDALASYYLGTTNGLPGFDAKRREDALRKARELAPRFAPALVALSALLLDASRILEARAAAIEAVAAEPGNVSALLALLRAAIRLEKADDIATVERWLLRRVRVDGAALHALVAHYESQKQLADAEALITRVRAKSPRNLNAVRIHARLLEKQGRLDEREAVLREGLAIERKTFDLLNELAYVNAERGVRLEEAVELADEALKMRPASSHALDTKGWALFRLGRIEEAETYIRRSLAADDAPVVRDHLGDILAKTGRSSEALVCWRKALEHPDVEDELTTAIQAKIAKVEGATP